MNNATSKNALIRVKWCQHSRQIRPARNINSKTL